MNKDKPYKIHSNRINHFLRLQKELDGLRAARIDKKLFYSSGSDELVSFDNSLKKLDSCNCGSEKLMVIEKWISGKETHDEFFICPKCNKTLWYREVKNMAVILQDIQY